MFEKYYQKANAAIKASEKQKEALRNAVEKAGRSPNTKRTVWGLPPRAVYTTAVCLVIVLVTAFLIPHFPKQTTPFLPGSNTPGGSSSVSPSEGGDPISPSSGGEDGSSHIPPNGGLYPVVPVPGGSAPSGGSPTDPQAPSESVTDPLNSGSSHPEKPEPPTGPTDPFVPPATDPTGPPKPTAPEPTNPGPDPTGNPTDFPTECPTEPTMPTDATDPTEPTDSTIPGSGQTEPTEPPVY